MVDKLQGGVACSHCRSISDAAQSCPICGRAVCPACLRLDNCPEPRLRALQLGKDIWVRAVDEGARMALVSRQTSREQNNWLYDLRADHRVAELHTPSGVDEVELTGCCGLAAGRAVWQVHDNPRATPEHWSYWFMVADVAGEAPQLLREVETECWAFTHVDFSADGRWMLGARYDVEAYLFETDEMKIAARFNLGDQVIHSLAISSELDLIAVGLFGAVHLWTLAEQRQLGRLKIEDGELTCIRLGGGRLVAISEDEVPHVVEIEPDRSPSRWAQRSLDRFKASGKLGQSEADLSSDGRLLAVRRRKKEVAVFDLQTGAEQRLEGHRSRVSLVRFVDGGNQLLSADDDGGVRFWPRVGQRMVDRG